MNIKTFQFAIAWLLSLPLVLSAEEATSDLATTPINEAMASQQRLRQDIRFLAGDDLRGRGVEDESIDVAADYIADQMSQSGFIASKLDGGPFQSISINLGTRAGPAEQNYVRFTRPQTGETILQASLDDGMMPLAIGMQEAVASGPLAFVGYGIKAASLGYDDYASIDVRGCVVMMIRKTPGMGNSSSVFGAKPNSRHALFSRKIKLAIQAGASAVLLINDPATAAAAVADVQRNRRLEEQRIADIEQQIDGLPEEANQTRQRLAEKIGVIRQNLTATEAEMTQAARGVMEIVSAGRSSNETNKIPVVSIGRDIADKLIAENGNQRTLESVETQIDMLDPMGRHRPSSFFVSGVRAQAAVAMTPSTRNSRNVIGMIDGRGRLASESVIIGAHYDHVGMGGYGSLAPGTVAVHNGADDNASGTAAMLEIGRLLQSRLTKHQQRRRIILVAFTGEERGLLGSQYFVRHPRVGLDQVQTMINLDMVGRLRDDELTIYGTGSGTSLDSIVEQVNAKPVGDNESGSRFRLSKVSTGYGPSDHQSFYVAGVPVLFFFTGLHNDYHRPSDDVEKLSLEGLVRIVEMVADVSETLATMPQRVGYVAVEKSKEPVPIRRQLTVRIGISMSNGEVRRGVLVSNVLPSSPAENAGILVGDRLTQIDSASVNSPKEILETLRQYDPGNKIEISLVRAGVAQKVSLILTGRNP